VRLRLASIAVLWRISGLVVRCSVRFCDHLEQTVDTYIRSRNLPLYVSQNGHVVWRRQYAVARRRTSWQPRRRLLL